MTIADALGNTDPCVPLTEQLTTTFVCSIAPMLDLEGGEDVRIEMTAMKTITITADVEEDMILFAELITEHIGMIVGEDVLEFERDMMVDVLISLEDI